MEELGLTFTIAAIDTDNSVEVNAEVIKGHIEAAQKPLVILGHSKGGVDTAACLALNPHLYPKVRAFVAMQSPYAGTHISDIIESQEFMLQMAKQVVEEMFKVGNYELVVFVLFHLFEGQYQRHFGLEILFEKGFLAQPSTRLQEGGHHLLCYDSEFWAHASYHQSIEADLQGGQRRSCPLLGWHHSRK